MLPCYDWEHYLSLDELFQDSAVQVRFLDNQIEIMPPIGEPHEVRKIHVSCLLEAWMLDQEIEFFGTGAKTLKIDGEAGGELDESYSLHEKKEFPDLILEIAFTSGGLSERAFYAKFPIPEIWIWRMDRLEVHIFDSEKNEYTEVEASTLLPGLDIRLLEKCAKLESTSAAIREFRKLMV